MTPADELRAAADKIRDLTEKTAEAPWTATWDGQQYEVKSPSGVDPIAEWIYAIATWEPKVATERAECDTANADWIAAMHPGVGVALADWLMDTAWRAEPIGKISAHALAVARAILGRQP